MDYALEMLKEQRDSASKQRAAEIVTAVKNLHVDEMSIGTKVSFVKRFSGDQIYTYLALKTHNILDGIDMDRWYVTGRSRKYTNGEFEDLLAEKLGFEDFTVLAPVIVVNRIDEFLADPSTGVHRERPLKGWGADVNPAPSTHAVGPADPDEE
jgi:hypothetical protein